MNYLTGIVFLAAGVGLIVANRRLAELIARSNVAAFNGRAFSGGGFTLYGRVVMCLIGAAFAAIGGGFLLGFLEFE